MARTTAPVLDYDSDPYSIDDVEEALDALSPAFLCPLCDEPNDGTCIVVPAHESFALVHRACLEEAVGGPPDDEEEDEEHE